ncbi:MAG TPA: heme-binding protein [Candidatus Elarobacter sp.]
MIAALALLPAFVNPANAQPAPPAAAATAPPYPGSERWSCAFCFDIPYGAAIPLQRAKELALAAETFAKNKGWAEAIVVVDTAGEVVLSEKMDGIMNGGYDIAAAKAKSAARFRRPTSVFQNFVDGGHPSLAFVPGIMPAGGGFPLVSAGKVIGGIGCSGESGNQDVQTCQVGVDALK